MQATAFVSRSNAFASTMLATRGEPYRGAIKRDDRRCARHSHNAALATVSLDELRKDFDRPLSVNVNTKRDARYSQTPQFQPGFLLADLPAPTKYVEVIVTRKRASQRKPVVEKLVLAS